ncbi:MAG: hypothetical protein IPH62_15000 [Ignavibacteriae bacterium]|nr:hypothetical protein [Ignavibacteriota bacterium]
MFELAPNPYSDPIKKFHSELKGIQWKPPFILQTIQAIISSIILVVLSLFYITVGVVAQISTTFWDLILGLGEKMSFSQPIESTAYAIALALYFILFLPFFILQSPIWMCGWLATKIGLKPFIAIVFIFTVATTIYFYTPETATQSYAKIIEFQDSIRKEYFAQDSVNVIATEEIAEEPEELPKKISKKKLNSRKRK